MYYKNTSYILIPYKSRINRILRWTDDLFHNNFTCIYLFSWKADIYASYDFLLLLNVAIKLTIIVLISTKFFVTLQPKWRRPNLYYCFGWVAFCWQVVLTIAYAMYLSSIRQNIKMQIMTQLQTLTPSKSRLSLWIAMVQVMKGCELTIF